MGKVSKRLTIVVFPPLDQWPEILKLEEQGHKIIQVLPDNFEVRDLDLEDADLILGPRCWYMTGLHRQHLTQAIKQARLRRYGTISKKGDKKDEKDDISGSNTDPEFAGC